MSEPAYAGFARSIHNAATSTSGTIVTGTAATVASAYGFYLGYTLNRLMQEITMVTEQLAAVENFDEQTLLTEKRKQLQDESAAIRRRLYLVAALGLVLGASFGYGIRNAPVLFDGGGVRLEGRDESLYLHRGDDVSHIYVPSGMVAADFSVAPGTPGKELFVNTKSGEFYGRNASCLWPVHPAFLPSDLTEEQKAAHCKAFVRAELTSYLREEGKSSTFEIEDVKVVGGVAYALICTDGTHCSVYGFYSLPSGWFHFLSLVGPFDLPSELMLTDEQIAWHSKQYFIAIDDFKTPDGVTHFDVTVIRKEDGSLKVYVIDYTEDRIVGVRQFLRDGTFPVVNPSEFPSELGFAAEGFARYEPSF